ncbi:related to nitrilase [Sporisorium reilianum SRZ2]|uniref:Related to nitrilase n=1 Tax=Sporisorium reilianum (strain SRZ2) TaxID=999809 RepID=E7A3H5_SPORE|nr:related to nitrilase [Sporisorium reilianum SRZ2]
MSGSTDEVILCCVQDSPVSFDLQASLDKLSKLAREAATKARAAASSPTTPIVVLFPEAFLSAYPRGLDFGAKIGHRTAEGRSWFARYHASSVPVCDTDGPEMTIIRNAAKDNGITLVVGVIERCDAPETGKKRHEYGSNVAGGAGTIYCTALTISETGEVLASHRKLMPTGTERLVWGQGDGQGIRVVPTRAGAVGSVICWENYMPLLRSAMYERGVEIYCAPTADSRPTWTSSMQHIAMEGRCYVISCNQFNTRSDFPQDYPALNDLKPDEVVTRGGSVIVGPLGDILAGPLFDEAGILVAKVNRSELIEAKMDFDVAGHYARNDVLRLQVNDKSS